MHTHTPCRSPLKEMPLSPINTVCMCVSAPEFHSTKPRVTGAMCRGTLSSILHRSLAASWCMWLRIAPACMAMSSHECEAMDMNEARGEVG